MNADARDDLAAPPEAATGSIIVKEMLGWGRSSRLGVRFGRYTLGSVVAAVTSEVAFVACYGTGLLGTTASSAVAFLAGAIPNYVLNRQWAFSQRGKVHVGREVVLYAVVSVVSFLAAAAGTKWASHWAPHVTSSGVLRTGLVATAYLVTQGVLFVAKFVVFQKVIFTQPTETPPTETQPTMASAAQTPTGTR